jgi:hypothetical protein
MVSKVVHRLGVPFPGARHFYKPTMPSGNYQAEDFFRLIDHDTFIFTSPGRATINEFFGRPGTMGLKLHGFRSRECQKMMLEKFKGKFHILHVTRPRDDVMESLRKKALSDQPRREFNCERRYHVTMKRVDRFVRAAQMQRERLLTIPANDMITNPAHWVHRIVKFLHLDITPRRERMATRVIKKRYWHGSK